MSYLTDVAIAIKKEDLPKTLETIPTLSKLAEIYESKKDKEVIIINFAWIDWSRDKFPEIENLMCFLNDINAIFVSRGESINDNEEEYYNDAEDLYEHLELIRYINFEGNLIKERGK